MTSITIDKQAGNKEPLARRGALDPFGPMRELMRWDPFREGFGLLEREPAFAPAFEIKETKDAFEFRADVPGIDSKDIQVQITDNRLSIRGKREAEKSDKSDTYYTYERSFGSFERSFVIPEGVSADAIRADLKDGVLKVELPKRPESRPRDVQVKSG